MRRWKSRARSWLLAAGGVAFDQVAIFLRAADSYRDVVEEALRRAQIPAHFADGVRRPVPEGRAFLALLACAREGLSARAFAEYLSLGVAPLDASVPSPERGTAGGVPSEEEPKGTLRSPRRWERLLVDASVIGGRARWERRLKTLMADVKSELESVGPESPRHDSLKVQGEQLEALFDFALPVLDLLAALPLKASWADWLSALDALARRCLNKPESVCDALLELAPLGMVGPVELVDVERLLSRRLGTAIVRSTGPWRGQGVRGQRGRRSRAQLRGRVRARAGREGVSAALHEDPSCPT